MKKIFVFFVFPFVIACHPSKRSTGKREVSFESSLRWLYGYVDTFHTRNSHYDSISGYDFAKRSLDGWREGSDSLVNTLWVRSARDTVKAYFVRNSFRITIHGREISEEIMFYLKKRRGGLVYFTSASYTLYDENDTSHHLIRSSPVRQEDIERVIQRIR